ncbi:hypothetical protein GWK47_035035 [Chionoecetes opilio]|uniref:Uncharacterized protein n=1 Tax=Chionoecetes opilio TaxID=41210 RepID=A0A8J4YNJ3_CHIOP|nr:hypothetical protein GWK47_035035 [Chionoecetes opilio]
MRGITLDPSLTPNCVLETLAEPLVDSLVNGTQQGQEQGQDELEELSCEVGELEALEQALVQGPEEIIVFQQEDGTLLNQDGIPISRELQYLIASSQDDHATSLGPDSQDNHLFVPPEAFEGHTIDVNCEL